MTKKEIFQKAQEFVESFHDDCPNEYYVSDKVRHTMSINEFLQFIGIKEQIKEA